jgi:hypothetical protein
VTKLSNRVLISVWAVPTPTGSVSCRRTFRTDLAFQNLMFFDPPESGQLASAVPAGGGSPSHGAQRPGVAQQVFPPGPAAGTEDCQGRHGP